MSANKLCNSLSQIRLKTLFIKFTKATGDLDQPNDQHYKLIMTIFGSNAVLEIFLG